MGRETTKDYRPKFSRVKEWWTLFCPECNYAVELCNRTKNFSYCPLCLREGKETLLEKRLNKV